MDHNFRVFIAINCGGNYTGIATHWTVTDPAITDAWLLAEQLGEELAGDGATAGLFVPLQAILSQDSFIQSIRVRQLAPVPGATYVKVFPPGDFPGSLSTNVEAAQVAGVGVWVTAAQAGVSGRNFFPGVAEESIDNGRFVTQYQTDFNTLRTYMCTPIVGTSETWTFTLRQTTGPNYLPIVDGYLSPTPGTMRRRLLPY